MTDSTGPECDRAAIAHGLCNSHERQRRHGEALTPLCSDSVKGACAGPTGRRRSRPRWREEVQENRRLHAEGVAFRALGRRFGCSALTAARICKRWSARAGGCFCRPVATRRLRGGFRSLYQVLGNRL